MKLSETARRAFEASCDEKAGPLRKEHENRLSKIHWMTHMPAVVAGKEELLPVTSEARFNFYIAETKRYAEELANSRIDAFIDIHKIINDCPDQEEVDFFIDELAKMSKTFFEQIKRDFDNPLSAYSTQELKQQRLFSLENEFGMIVGFCVPRLQKFVSEAALRKELNLPISEISSSQINIVSVGGNVNGPIQSGTSNSNQTASGLSKPYGITEEQEAEAYPKISEWLKIQKIGKGKWIDYKDIASETGLEVWVIKECVKYAAFLAHMEVSIEQPNAVLISSRYALWG